LHGSNCYHFRILLAQECLDAQGRQEFKVHEQETRQHIRNLEQCFQILGNQPSGIENYTAAGLQRDHDMFLLQKPPKNLQQEVNAANTLAAVARQIGQLQAQAMQRPPASPPVPNQPGGPAITPMPGQQDAPVANQPYQATGPQVQNHSNAPVNAPVSNQPSSTGSTSSASKVQKGMQVVGSNMGNKCLYTNSQGLPTGGG
jgi:hypothetical protein